MAQQSTPEAPSSEVKSCKVVLEDIFSFCHAGKLRMLRSSQEKTHKTCSHHPNEEMLLTHMQVKPPVAWGKLSDESWLQLDDTVHRKLTKTRTLSERLNHLESTIFAEAATLFGHSPPPSRNLAGQISRTKLSINLIKEKNLLLAQIKSSSLLERKIALDHLLLHVRSKIRSLRKAEQNRKRRWLLKKARNDFKRNPYKAGKSLLDPKCFVSLKVDQANLDQHKASSLNDQS